MFPRGTGTALWGGNANGIIRNPAFPRSLPHRRSQTRAPLQHSGVEGNTRSRGLSRVPSARGQGCCVAAAPSTLPAGCRSAQSMSHRIAVTGSVCLFVPILPLSWECQMVLAAGISFGNVCSAKGMRVAEWGWVGGVVCTPLCPQSCDHCRSAR